MPSWLNYQLRRMLLPDAVGSSLVVGHVDPPEQMVAISHVQAIEDAYVPEVRHLNPGFGCSNVSDQL